MPINTRFLVEVFKSQYNSRLNEVIGEADAFDDAGNMILSPDLKVKHKESGYEYTIGHIEGEDGTLQIHLRSPESPRVEPQPEEQSLLGEPKAQDILGEQDPAIVNTLDHEQSDEHDPEETVFVINQKEFEKEYEVD
jgi:hypothetical protein